MPMGGAEMAGNTDSVKLEVLSHAEMKKLNKDELIKKLLAAESYGLSVQAQLDSMNEKLSSLSMKVDAMENKEPSSLAINSSSQFIKLEKELYATQQYSRRDTIEICGIPSSVDDKSLEKKSMEILATIGCKVSPAEIQACHRLHKKDRTIIKFCNRKSALQCLRNKSKLKTFDAKAVGLPECKLYINESLCQYYRHLLWVCRGLLKENKVKGCRTFNGTIRLKLQNDEEVLILHTSDIAALKL